MSLMFLLLFFSKTIYTYHLPEVTAVRPQKGKLSKVEMGYGTVQWAKTESIYVPEAGIVDEIFINEGEYVEAGQPLFSMKYDREINDRLLEESGITRKRLEAELQEIENLMESAKQPDAEFLKTRQSLAQAEKNLAAAAVLYEIGGVSAQELSQARDEVEYLKLKVKNLAFERTENEKKLELEAEAKKLELEQQAILEEPYREAREIHSSKTVVTAASPGFLISSGLSKGMKVQKDTLAATLGTGNEYILECPVSLENNFITAGDTCKLSNSSHQVKGVVSGVLPQDGGKTVRIRFTAENVMAGETFEVIFQKESETGYILVPNAAVCKDQDGTYLKQVKRREGIMGDEYYLDRIDIYTGDSDAKNTVVAQGVTFLEPVLLYSDKTAETGDVVLLKNAGDFFEE